MVNNNSMQPLRDALYSGDFEKIKTLILPDEGTVAPLVRVDEYSFSGRQLLDHIVWLISRSLDSSGLLRTLEWVLETFVDSTESKDDVDRDRIISIRNAYGRPALYKDSGGYRISYRLLPVLYKTKACLDCTKPELCEEWEVAQLVGFIIDARRSGTLDFFLAKLPEAKVHPHLPRITKYLILRDDVTRFKRLLDKFDHISFESDVLDDAVGEVKKALDYIPARRRKHRERLKTVRCYIQDDYDPSDVDSCRELASIFAARAHDSSLTTDDESSNSDDESCKPRITRQFPTGKWTDGHLLYRGKHLSSQLLEETVERSDVLRSVRSGKTVYSLATKAMRDKTEKPIEHADGLVKAYLEMLAITGDKRDLDESGRLMRGGRSEGWPDRDFNNLYVRFVHAYVNKGGFEYLFKKGGMERNYKFPFSHNPVLSTSKRPGVACAYALGKKDKQRGIFEPKVRKSTGVPKHRSVGYVQCFLIDPEYYQCFATDVDELTNQSERAIFFNHSPNAEVIIHSSIPDKHILGHHIFSLPSFRHEWTEQIEESYGLNKVEYDKYRQQLPELSDEGIRELVDEVTSHQFRFLAKEVELRRLESLMQSPRP